VKTPPRAYAERAEAAGGSFAAALGTSQAALAAPEEVPQMSAPSNGPSKPGKPAVRQRVASWLVERFDLILTVIMAIAAVGTAWAGFENTKWSGEQANSYAEAGAYRVEASRHTTLAGQERIADVVSFTQWLSASNEEIVADESAKPGATHPPRAGEISTFLFQRFRPEFRVAADAWLATGPFVNPGAPQTPFKMAEYNLAEDVEAARVDAQADQSSAEARDANQIADNYVLTAVFFALVLFFAGIAGRSQRRPNQLLLLGIATVALIAATVLMLTFPVDF